MKDLCKLLLCSFKSSISVYTSLAIDQFFIYFFKYFFFWFCWYCNFKCVTTFMTVKKRLYFLQNNCVFRYKVLLKKKRPKNHLFEWEERKKMESNPPLVWHVCTYDNHCFKLSCSHIYCMYMFVYMLHSRYWLILSKQYCT